MERVEKRTEYLAADVRELVLDISYAECLVQEAATDTITVEAILDGEHEAKYHCSLSDGILAVSTGSYSKTISINGRGLKKSDIEKQVITVTIPYEMPLEVLELCVGAGSVKLTNASTSYKRVELEVGAGKLYADRLNVAGHIDVETGAGSADIGNLTAATASVECGVGKLSVKGAVEGNIDISCGVGSIVMYLDAAESDYNYDIDCGIGSVVINGSKRGGLFTADANMVHPGAKGTINLECGVGKIELITQKRLA